MALYDGKPSFGRHIIEPGLVERLLDRIQPFISVETPELIDGARRERLWYYPPEAIREAVINSLVHRDWTYTTEVEMNRYAHQLEIINPGRMQNYMTIEKMLAGQRMPRNPLIADIMRDYGYVDARGMGVRRKIVPLTQKYSGKDAEFKATEDYLSVTLPAKVIHFK